MQVIAHNLLSQFSSRQLNITDNNKSKSSEKLSSGYRINRAADDVAGLAISEKMRWQVRGLNRASLNIEDGISICRVADGALHEVHAMLQRMNELTIQAANDTNTKSDREAIQYEIDALITEIDRIGDDTEFNTMKVFRKADGDVPSQDVLIPNPTVEGKFFQLLGNKVSHAGYMEEPLDKNMITYSTSPFFGNTSYVSAHIDFSEIESHIQDLVDTKFYVNCCTDCCPKLVSFTDNVGIWVNRAPSLSEDFIGEEYLNEIQIGLKKSDGNYYTDAAELCEMIVKELKPVIDPYGPWGDPGRITAEHVQFACNGKTLYLYDVDNNNWSDAEKKLAYFCDPVDDSNNDNILLQAGGWWIQTGAMKDQGFYIQTGRLSSIALDIHGLNVFSCASSGESVKKIQSAVDTVSRLRSHIGAQQNRLEHGKALDNLTAENSQTAESRIRDTDMAEEMVNQSKHSILQQAGQSMLAQANQSTNGILQLLDLQ